MLVATDGDAILGVACVTSRGEVTVAWRSLPRRQQGPLAKSRGQGCGAWQRAVRPHQYGHGSLVLSFGRVWRAGVTKERLLHELKLSDGKMALRDTALHLASTEIGFGSLWAGIRWV